MSDYGGRLCELCARVIEPFEDYLELRPYGDAVCTNCVEENMRQGNENN